jgi:uncharacterized protein (DUF362 family)
MEPSVVSIVKYETPRESVARAVELAGGLDGLVRGAKVVIKPNIVFWTKSTPFPKYGVITTSRVVEDIVALLKDRGASDIAIIEGVVTSKAKDYETPQHAFEYLGYKKLGERYGVRPLNVFQQPFREVDLGGGVVLNMNADALDADFVVDLPVLKTHAQTTVSLGIKNLKGLINIESRKKCHNADPEKNLHYHVARLANGLPNLLTVIDGIYSNERGPAFDGKAHRLNVLVASRSALSADLVGARLLGYDPAQVPHLVHAAKDRNRPLDLSDVQIKGESIESLAQPHQYSFPYNEAGDLPAPMVKAGISGVHYYKYDDTMCTYCSGVNGVALAAIAMAWKGQAWDDVEILTGKRMSPRPGMKKTILLGKCMYDLHKDDPNIKEMIAIKGCPPPPSAIVKAFHQAGIMVDANLFEHMDLAPGFFLRKYQDRPEFEESFFQVE